MAFARYSAIGGVATVTHYSVLVGLVEGAHVAPALASSLGAACGALTAYAGNRRYTFPDCPHSHRTALPRFLLVGTSGAVLNGCVVWTGMEILSWHYLAAQVIATFLTLLVTYGINRAWTFT